MISCEKAKELIPQYLSKSLSSKETVEVLSHIAKCSDCRQELLLFLSVKQALNNETVDITDEITNSAFQKIHELKNEEETTPQPLTIYEAFNRIKNVMWLSNKVLKIAHQTL